MNTTTEFTFNTSFTVVFVAVIAFLLILALAVAAFRRSSCDRTVGVLELMRVLITLLAVATLCQPEWKEVYQPIEKPTMLVLHDDSKSMQTRDVLDIDDPTAEPVSRADWLEQLPDAIWDPLRDTVDVMTDDLSTSTTANPGSGTNIDRALSESLKRYQNLRAVVLMSDGDWNEGQSPANAATRFRINDVPIFAVALGSETPLPDIEIVSLEPPTFSVTGKSIQVPFGMRSTMAVDYEVEVSLVIRDGTELKQRVVVPAKGQVSDVFVWTPEDTGSIELSLDVPPHPDEVVRENNHRTVSVDVKPESLKMLVIESLPRWEYRYLRNALERDPGVDVSCILLHPGLSKRGGGSGYIKEFPDSIDHLAEFDVVFLGDVGIGTGQLTSEQCAMIKGLVGQQAGGLILMPGMQGNQFSLLSTELNDLVPVVMDQTVRTGFGFHRPARFVLTEIGQSNLLTKLADTAAENTRIWNNLPGFQWRSPAIRHKAGCEVLAIHEESRAPILVTKTYGTGKILFMGTDSAWRWRQGVEDKYHYRFWGQVARWMAYQRHMAKGEMLRLFYSPDRPEPDNVVTLHATVLDATGVPLKKGTVTGDLVIPSGSTKKIRFQPAGVDWGLYTARFTPRDAGSYQLKLVCQETSENLTVIIDVQGKQREVVGKPARYDVLQEIADISRGRFVAYNDMLSIRHEVLQLPAAKPAIRRKQLWASPYWAGTLIGVMSAFWIFRKMKGAI